MEELNRAYEALQKAHDAGDVEGAKQIAEYARSLEAGSKADNYAAGAQDEGLGVPESVVGTALGATLGAAAGPAVGATVDTAANIGAKMINPAAANAANMPESNSPAGVRKWLATQTSNPYAGGKDQGEAYRKAEIAAGKPVQSRGAKTPIRKGNLSIHNQIPETTLPQKAAANIINAEKVGKPGIARRVAGMGVAGGELGNMIEEAKQGNIGRAALSGLGALGGSATQSSNKNIRRIGTGLSIAVPAIQKFIAPDEDAEVQKKAAGGAIQNFERGGVALAKKLVGFLEHTPKKPNELVGTRYKSTDLGGLIEPTPFDIEKAIGAKVIHRPYDLSGRNQLVEEVSGHKLLNPVTTEGGQPFGRDIKLQATGQGGASNKSINNRILKRVESAAKEGNGQVFNIPSTMGYGSEAFSNMPIDIIRDLINQREFSPETLKYLSNLVRAKSPNLEKFLGFEHPEVGKQLTEGGFGLTTTPGKLRVGATQAMMGKENKAQSLIDYNQEDLFNAIRAPELRDVPPGYMGETIMEAMPGHPGFKTGNHRAYDSGDASLYRGQGVNAPISIWMPDAYKQALAEVRSAPKTAGNAPGHQRAMARNVLGTAEEGVAQTITPQVADNLQRYQEAVKSGDLDKNDLEAIHKYIYGNKSHEYAKGGSIKDYENELNIPEHDTKSSLPDVSLSANSIPSMSGQLGVGYMQAPQGAMTRLQMEKELEKAGRLRAGVSAMGMAIPGQSGVKLMPGQMDLGYNTQAGPGNLDVSAYRSINPIPGRGHMQGVRANYSIPFAKGGKVAAELVEAFKKKFTPGFYHGSPSNNIKAFDPNATPNKFITDAVELNKPRGATWVTQDPGFADEFLPPRVNAKQPYRTGSTMYPVSVNLGNSFDPTKPESLAVLQNYLKSNPEAFSNYLGAKKDLPKYFSKGDWDILEDRDFMKHLQGLGHDSMTVTEGGQKNVAVFNPQNIRGKFAKFNPEDAESPDFMKAKGGLARIKK